MAGINLDEIYSEHAAEVYKFLLKLCGDNSLAEDLMQDTFLKAIEKIDTFDERCRLTSWLCQIAKNTYFDHLRKKQRRPHFLLEDENTEPSAPSFEESLDRSETAKEIRNAVHQLNEPYKEVFMLRVYAELSFKEIAAMFGKTEVWGRVTFLRSKDMVLRIMEKTDLIQKGL